MTRTPAYRRSLGRAAIAASLGLLPFVLLASIAATGCGGASQTGKSGSGGSGTPSGKYVIAADGAIGFRYYL